LLHADLTVCLRENERGEPCVKYQTLARTD
jgi:hypothetical protein